MDSKAQQTPSMSLIKRIDKVLAYFVIFFIVIALALLIYAGVLLRDNHTVSASIALIGAVLNLSVAAIIGLK